MENAGARHPKSSRVWRVEKIDDLVVAEYIISKWEILELIVRLNYIQAGNFIAAPEAWAFV